MAYNAVCVHRVRVQSATAGFTSILAPQPETVIHVQHAHQDKRNYGLVAPMGTGYAQTVQATRWQPPTSALHAWIESHTHQRTSLDAIPAQHARRPSIYQVVTSARAHATPFA